MQKYSLGGDPDWCSVRVGCGNYIFSSERMMGFSRLADTEAVWDSDIEAWCIKNGYNGSY